MRKREGSSSSATESLEVRAAGGSLGLGAKSRRPRPRRELRGVYASMHSTARFYQVPSNEVQMWKPRL